MTNQTYGAGRETAMAAIRTASGLLTVLAGGGGEGGGGGIASASQGEQRIISSGQTWQIGPRARWGVRMASMSLSFNKSASQHVKHR